MPVWISILEQFSGYQTESLNKQKSIHASRVVTRKPAPDWTPIYLGGMLMLGLISSFCSRIQILILCAQKPAAEIRLHQARSLTEAQEQAGVHSSVESRAAPLKRRLQKNNWSTASK